MENKKGFEGEVLKNFLPEISKAGHVDKDRFNIERFFNVPFRLRVVIMRKTLKIRDIEILKIGDVIPISKEDGSIMNITVYVSSVPLYYGEIVINDDKFGIRITHIIDEKTGSERYLKELGFGKVNEITDKEHKDSSKQKSKSEMGLLENKERFVDVDIQLRLELGHTVLTLRRVLECNIGTFLNLDKDITEPLTLYGSNIPLFKGEIVNISEDSTGFRITEIIG